MRFIFLLLILTGLGVYQESDAAVFYADIKNNPHTGVTCSTTGLSTSSPFCSIDLFTEVARNAGDILFVRRGNATTTHGAGLASLTLTSDGTNANPIIISADYDNLWSDFSTSTETFTVTAGSSTMIASGPISVIATIEETILGIKPGNWIYVEGDCAETFNSLKVNPCEFAYEIRAVSGREVSLYTPYKGGQAGSGRNLRIMPAVPVRCHFSTGTCSLVFDGDNFWYFKGLHFRATASGGIIQVDLENANILFEDVEISGNGISDIGISHGNNGTIIRMNKIISTTTFSGEFYVLGTGATPADGLLFIKDSFIEDNIILGVTDDPRGLSFFGYDNTLASITSGNADFVYCRNCKEINSTVDLSSPLVTN